MPVIPIPDNQSAPRSRFAPLFAIPPVEERIPLGGDELRHLTAGAVEGLLTFLELLLTPAIAWRLLRANGKNRRIHWDKVRHYADAIRRGEWKHNGEALKVDSKGRLVDGQHRCCAVIYADTPVFISVCIGVDPGCFDTIDIGKARTPGDTFSILGEEHPELLAAAVRWVWKDEEGHLLTTGEEGLATRQQLEDTLARHPAIRESVKLATPAFRVLPKSVATYLHYRFSRIDPAATQYFFEMLGKGVGIDRTDHPVYVLRNQLGKVQKDRPTMIWLTMRSWNAFRQGARQVRFDVSRWDRKTWPELI